MTKRLGDFGTGRREENNYLSLIVFVLLFGFVTATAMAQRATGTISGRVVTEDGHPIPHAKVNITGVGGLKKILAGRMDVITDEHGNFTADKLDPAPYSITATAPGYVLMPNEKVGGQLGAVTLKYAHLGDSVTIRMLRGGVITGKVLNASGEPVIGISVQTIRVRDENGRPVNEQVSANDLEFGRQTDDRGVYRIYGLTPGSYAVAVGSGAMGFSLRATPFAGRAKIYYPSATRDTATEVTVRSGEEASGIDIRYRIERGAAISGKISGAPTGGQPAMTTTVVTLTKAGTDNLIETAVVLPMGDNNSYSFYGVPNGEYELMATRPDMSGADTMMSAPRKVTVSGRDLTGIDLALLASSSISGTIKLEKLAAPPAGQKCESGRDSFLDEIILQAKPDDQNQKSSVNQIYGGLGVTAPNDKGEFTISSLRAGRHFVESQLPDEHWFVKSALLTSAAANNPAAREAGKNGITLKVGEKVTGLAVTLAEGAAGLKGKLTGDKLPSRVRVHLLPAEPEAKDDLLRFAEVRAEEGGAFNFTNIAPGKYLLVARVIPDSESSDKPAKPAGWDAVERAKLRKEAEAANAVVELKTCQRVADFNLRWAK